MILLKRGGQRLTLINPFLRSPQRDHEPHGGIALRISKRVMARPLYDAHRFPPYQHIPRNCLVNRRGEYRIPSVPEREYMMGLPVGYTQMCLPKSERKSTAYSNGWTAPVVTWLGQLVWPRGLGPSLTLHRSRGDSPGRQPFHPIPVDATTFASRAGA